MRDAHLLCNYSMSLSVFRKLWAINVRRVLSYNFTYCAIKGNQKFCNFPYSSKTGRKCISMLNKISCAVSILRSVSAAFCYFSSAKEPETQQSFSPDGLSSGEILSNSKQEQWLHATFSSSAGGCSINTTFLSCFQMYSSGSQVAKINL